jgi:hypothetical protein
VYSGVRKMISRDTESRMIKPMISQAELLDAKSRRALSTTLRVKRERRPTACPRTSMEELISMKPFSRRGASD